MRSYGLKPNEIETIKKLLNESFGDLKDVKVFLFGSRAKGDHKLFSDIDLAIKSKSPELSKKIARFKEEVEESKLPYKFDVSSWDELYEKYLPEIKKTKTNFWDSGQKMLHLWRVCPYGQHWVVRHPRFPVGRQLQDVDGHCRKNPSGKDSFDADEIELISKLPDFNSVSNRPNPYSGKHKIKNADDFDYLISGWTQYWNDIFKSDSLLEPNFVKALIESESKFNPNAEAPNKKSVGPARGAIQITEQTLRILRDRKGELKDHFIDLKKEDLFVPALNICAGIRWLFRKREILVKRLKRSPTWTEVMIE